MTGPGPPHDRGGEPGVIRSDLIAVVTVYPSVTFCNR
jgi:hypothetical protein